MTPQASRIIRTADSIEDDVAGPLTVRDRCVNPDIDTAIGMAEDSITAAGLPWTAAPILFR